MIQPERITDFKRSPEELEEFILFAMFVQGKSSDQTVKKLDQFLSLVRNGTPFQKVRALIKHGDLQWALETTKLGKWNQYGRGLKELVSYPQLDLRSALVEEMERIYSVGPKSARFFVLHTRPGEKRAVLDTHVLRWMRTHKIRAEFDGKMRLPPDSTPAVGVAYNRWEKALFDYIEKRQKAGTFKADMDWTKFDHTVWIRGSRRESVKKRVRKTELSQLPTFVKSQIGLLEKAQSKQTMSGKRPHMLTDFEKGGLKKKLLTSFFAKDHIGSGQRSNLDTMVDDYDWRLIRLNPRDIIESCLRKPLAEWLKEEEQEYAYLEGKKVKPFPFRDEPIIIGTRQIGRRNYAKDGMMCAFGDDRYMIWDGFHRVAAAIRGRVAGVWVIVIDIDRHGTRRV